MITFVLFTITFVTATPIDPEANYKIIDCENLARCWGTESRKYGYIIDVPENACEPFNIKSVTSFENEMVLIRTAKINPHCSECNIAYGGTILQTYPHTGEGIRIIEPFLVEGVAEENVCFRLWYEGSMRNIAGRKYKFVRM